MGEKLTNTTYEPTPVVGITQKEGTFKGTLLDKGREVKVKKGKKFVYGFNIVSNDKFPIELKQDDGSFKEVDVAEGDRVSVFAPTMLHNALQKANVGDVITIKYLGMAEGENGEYHNFDVERD